VAGVDNASRVIRWCSACWFLLGLGLVTGCSGPPVSSVISGDPICPDFTLGPGGTQMHGGLRRPVRVTVRYGSSEVASALIFGRATASEPPPRIRMPDSSAEYTVEWGQCENERAPKPAGTDKTLERAVAKYECGAAAAYKTDKLVTKSGDIGSHALTYVPPPEPACWQDERPPEEAVADAGAPDAGSVEDAGSAGDAGDAGAASDAGAAGDAAVRDASAPSPSTTPAREKQPQKP